METCLVDYSSINQILMYYNVLSIIYLNVLHSYFQTVIIQQTQTQTHMYLHLLLYIN